MAKVYFEYGTMDSGKSLEVLKVAYSYRKQGKSILLGKSAVDSRSKNTITTRAGMEPMPVDFVIGPEAKVYDPDNPWTGLALYQIYNTDLYQSGEHISAILIDEAQFLSPDQVESIVLTFADKKEIPVMFFGLKTDFLGHLFPGSEKIIELADELKEIKSTCKYCERKATMNARVNSKGEKLTHGDQVLVGDSEYVSVCRYHWYELPEAD